MVVNRSETARPIASLRICVAFTAGSFGVMFGRPNRDICVDTLSVDHSPRRSAGSAAGALTPAATTPSVAPSPATNSRRDGMEILPLEAEGWKTCRGPERKVECSDRHASVNPRTRTRVRASPGRGALLYSPKSYEGHHPRRRVGVPALSSDPGHQQAARADLQQAHGVLPA